MDSLTNWFKSAIKAILNFWRKDIINKLIILVSFALVVCIIFVASNLIATPEMSVVYATLFKKAGGIPTIIAVPATANPIFTPTTAFFPSVTAFSNTEISPSASSIIANKSTPNPATATTISAFFLPSVTLPSPSSASTACIPGNPRQTGKVIGVIDGNTIKVYTDNLVYVVRYIGIDVPKYDSVKEPYGDAAMFKNSNLVFGKEVSLVKDVSDKDPVGRLLRYVLVGDTFVNLELAQDGFATAVDIAPDTACSQAFKDAEQAARQAQVGRWIPTATHPSP